MRAVVRRWLAVLLAGLAVATPAAGSVIITLHLEGPTPLWTPDAGISLDDSVIRIALNAPSPILVTSGLLRTTTGLLNSDTTGMVFFAGQVSSQQPAPVLEFLVLASGAGGGGLGVASIPEPGTLLLLAAGLALLHWIRPRR